MKKIVALLLAIAMLLSMSAAMADTLTIGVIGPFSGPAAVYGTAVRDAAIIAAEEINAMGGQQINLLTYGDDEHNSEKAVSAYNRMRDDDVQIILGTVTTDPCIAVGAKAYKDRLFMLTPSASSDLVVAEKDNVFQVCFADPVLGTFAAEYITEHKEGAKVGVIYNNGDAYSTGIYQAFAARAKELSLEIVSTTTFNDDTPDFSVQVASCKDNGADVVFLPIYYTPAANILTQANAVEYAPMFFGVDGMDGILDIEGFNKSLAEGVLLLTPFTASAQDEATVNFVKKYMDKYNNVPNQFAADAYDGIYALYQACQNQGVTEKDDYETVCEKMIEEFKTLHYVGLTGDMTWNEDGSVSKAPQVKVIKDGVYADAE